MNSSCTIGALQLAVSNSPHWGFDPEVYNSTTEARSTSSKFRQLKSERLGSCSKDLKMVVVMVTTVEVAAVDKVELVQAEVMDAVPKMPTAGNAN